MFILLANKSVKYLLLIYKTLEPTDMISYNGPIEGDVSQALCLRV